MGIIHHKLLNSIELKYMHKVDIHKCDCFSFIGNEVLV